MYLGVNRKGRDKMSGNPYSIGFGRIPTRFISRDILIDEIIDNINRDEIQGQAYKLTGIRGSGKTVTLTAIEKKVKEDDRWIVIPVKPESKITEELVGGIYNRVQLLSSFFSTSLNLSKFGIGLNISRVNPVSSIDAALEKIMALDDEYLKAEAVSNYAFYLEYSETADSTEELYEAYQRGIELFEGLDLDNGGKVEECRVITRYAYLLLMTCKTDEALA
jgi:hypothetical protein